MAKIILLCCLILLAAFGVVNGSTKEQEIGFYLLKKGDISVNFTNWGASIVSLFLPDKHGMSFL
jgi:aldose 1-epimerase